MIQDIKNCHNVFKCLLKKNYFFIVNILIVSVFLTCGTVSHFIVSDEQEIELGAQFRKQIVEDKENYPLYKNRIGYDSVVVKYIDSLGSLIAKSQSDRPDLEFTFTIIDNDTLVNAFAIPGGHVFIYTGLMLNADNGAEIAGVLAHEIGHITKYHGKQMITSQMGVETINQILFGDSASVVSTVTGVLETMAILKFGRTNEYEADECAVAYTTLVGINPRGMESFLQKLSMLEKEGTTIFEPFSTHPPIKKRIETVQNLINVTPNVPAVGERMSQNEYAAIRSLLGK